MYQQAYINLLNAEKYKPVGLFIEKAKLHWARGEQEIAFSILKRGIEAASTTNLTDNISMRFVKLMFNLFSVGLRGFSSLLLLFWRQDSLWISKSAFIETSGVRSKRESP